MNKIGLAEYQKIEFYNQIQAVFSEILFIHKKSEKLEAQAKTLFNKDKRLSPKSLEDIAHGRLDTSLWVVACAIELLLIEQLDVIKNILSADDLYMLWAKQLLDRGHKRDDILIKALRLNKEELIDKIKNYHSA